jgi:hypothetical protein
LFQILFRKHLKRAGPPRTFHAVSVATKAPFEKDAVAALERARGLFARLIERRCPTDRSVSAVAEAFAVHRKLAWQVGKVAYEEDPFVAARHMPSAKGLEVWLAAARRAGCRVGDVKAAAEAGARFHELAAAHARSGDELAMLLESKATGDPATHVKWRQQAFRGNSFVWGAHCRVLLSAMVLQPSAERERFFHMAQVRGFIGFRQTRPNVRWAIAQPVVADDHAQTNTGLRRVPLDPDAARRHSGVPVLPRFCSAPMPLFSRRTLASGQLQDEFVSGPVGQAGERTLVTGEVIRNLGAAHATENDKIAHFGGAVRIPAEVLHLDMFVHHALFGAVERELRMFSDLAGEVNFDESDALPVPEKIVALGRGLGLAQTPDVPAYADLAGEVFEKLGADPSEYELYRVRMEYPPMPVSLMFRHALPERKD